MTPSVVFIGAGNVASHLAPAIERSGSGNVIQVYSPTFSHAAELASRLKCAEVISDLAHIDRNANIYIVSIKDDGISPLVDSLAKTLQSRALWMHTSGSVPMDVFSPLTSRYGVYYPMQTFSKNAPLDMSEVPLFVEGNSEEVEYEIKEFAKKTFANVYH
ncbi:MAG: NAD(P)-binding domain-containing protein, partial [Duncaniella sp.]|nr:NAD(P)-binding domain-containing protein [Duncaniella sp.]